MKSSGEDSRGSRSTTTKVLENPEEIVKQVIHLAETSNGLSIVSVSGGMELIYNSFFDLYRKILDDYRRGQGKGIKWVINMDGKEGIDLVKKFIDLGMQIRHVKNLGYAMNFAVGENEVNATIEKMEGGKMVQSMLTSNEPMYIQHFYSIFEELWNKGIDAQDRIKAIEEGLESADIEIIANPKEGINHAWKIIRSARKEMAHLIYTYSLRVQDRQKRTTGYHLLLTAQLHSIWFCVCIGRNNRLLTEHGHHHQYSAQDRDSRSNGPTVQR